MKKFNFTKKQIGLSIYFIVGTIIIISAIWSVNSLFFSGAITKSNFSSSYENFDKLYSANYNYNDFPNELELVTSNCTFSDDNEKFTYTLTIKNTSGSDKSLEFQLFFGTAYTEKYATKMQGPFMSYTGDNAVFLKDGQEYSVQYTSVVIGSTDEEIENFKKSLNNIYSEIKISSSLKRVQMPINFLS